MPIMHTLPRTCALQGVLAAAVFLVCCAALPALGQGRLLSESPRYDGKLLTFRLPVAQLPGDSTDVAVWLPPGHDATTDAYPSVYLLHGGGASTYMQFVGFADAPRQIQLLSDAGRIEPPILVIPNKPSALGHLEYSRMIVEELVPWVEATFHARSGRQWRGIGGWSDGGSNALIACLAHPNVFVAAADIDGGASPYLPNVIAERLRSLVSRHKQYRYPVALWQQWARGNDWLKPESAIALFTRLQFDYRYVETDGSHDSSVLRMTDDALTFLADQFGERPRLLPDVERMIERLVVPSHASTQEFQIEVQLPSPLTQGQSLSLDPSEIGLPAPISFESAGAGRYITPVRAAGPLVNWDYLLPVRWHDGDSVHYLASVELTVLPDTDLVVFDGAPSPDWPIDTSRRLVASPGTFQDRAALTLESTGSWRIEWKSTEPEALFGYHAVAMDFHPGTAHAAEGKTPYVQFGIVPGGQIELIDRVDLTSATWQPIVIPISEFLSMVHIPMESVSIRGNLLGEFYLADVRLVRVVPPTETAVSERVEIANI
ncbi:MAG: hypothetical protein HOM68_18015, partial [Gemmatimonadetes bacterium]|nr:hypothetical protein [Gemmatimonadota bacterium]